MAGTLCMLLVFFSGGVSLQEGPSTEEEWNFLLEQLMIRMAEESAWEETAEAEFPESFPETNIMENESVSGETLLRLLLDENTDMETRLIILEMLRNSEDPDVMEEILKAFAQQENGIPNTKSKTSPPKKQGKPKVNTEESLPTGFQRKEFDAPETTEESYSRWINSLVGGLALFIAGGFIFMRRGQA